jgi:hypothetical protein
MYHPLSASRLKMASVTPEGQDRIGTIHITRLESATRAPHMGAFLGKEDGDSMI